MIMVGQVYSYKKIGNFVAPAFECCKGDYNRILTRINAALGESEEQ